MLVDWSTVLKKSTVSSFVVPSGYPGTGHEATIVPGHLLTPSFARIRETATRYSIMSLSEFMSFPSRRGWYA